MIDILTNIGRFILALLLCTLFFIPLIPCINASSTPRVNYRYKPKCQPNKLPNEVKIKIK